jgi:hypothetical protein
LNPALTMMQFAFLLFFVDREVRLSISPAASPVMREASA